MGAQGPTAKSEMQQVCSTLSEVWTLPVLCDCMTVDDRVCKGTCMTTSLTAMGLTTHLREEHPPLIYAQPSGLTSDLHLKYTVTLQTPTTYAHKHISSIIVSAVLNVHPFLHTWLGCLVSLYVLGSAGGPLRIYKKHCFARATLRSTTRYQQDTLGC